MSQVDFAITAGNFFRFSIQCNGTNQTTYRAYNQSLGSDVFNITPTTGGFGYVQTRIEHIPTGLQFGAKNWTGGDGGLNKLCSLYPNFSVSKVSYDLIKNDLASANWRVVELKYNDSGSLIGTTYYNNCVTMSDGLPSEPPQIFPTSGDGTTVSESLSPISVGVLGSITPNSPFPIVVIEAPSGDSTFYGGGEYVYKIYRSFNGGDWEEIGDTGNWVSSADYYVGSGTYSSTELVYNGVRGVGDPDRILDTKIEDCGLYQYMFISYDQVDCVYSAETTGYTETYDVQILKTAPVITSVQDLSIRRDIALRVNWNQIADEGANQIHLYKNDVLYQVFTNTGTTSYTDYDVDCGQSYTYKIQTVLTGTSCQSDFSNELTNSVVIDPPEITSIDDETSTAIIGGVLTYYPKLRINYDVVDKRTSYVDLYKDGVVVQSYNYFSNIADVPTYNYQDFDLQPNTEYNYQAITTLTGTSCSGISTIETAEIPIVLTAPSGLTASLVNVPSEVQLDWTITDTGSSKYIIERSTSPTAGFVQFGIVEHDVVTFINDTALINGTTYYYRVRGAVLQFDDPIYSPYSEVVAITYYEARPPTGITCTNPVFYDFTSIQWDNNYLAGSVAAGYLNYVQQQLDSGGWFTVTTLPLSATTYTITGLDPATSYNFRVAIGKDGFIGAAAGEVATCSTLALPDPFCPLDNKFTISGTTSCGASDGSIEINNFDDYEYFYSFTIEDLQGNPYSFNSSGVATGLSSNYYFITATPITGFLRDSCRIDNIIVPDDANTMSVDNTIIRPAICAGFDTSGGRIVFDIDDTGASTGWTTSLYNTNPTLIRTVESVDENLIIIDNLAADTYFAIIENSEGCKLFIPSVVVPTGEGDPSGTNPVNSSNLGYKFSLAGVKEVYITEWSQAIDWNNWSISDEDYYISGLDTNEFQSTKIKEFTTTGLTWYSLPNDGTTYEFSQRLDKVRQGFVFNDVLTLSIPKGESSKWSNLTSVLSNRYVVVFKDNNGFWWTFGYKRGAEVSSYTYGITTINEYSIEFTSVSDNKILTALDEQWAINNIL